MQIHLFFVFAFAAVVAVSPTLSTAQASEPRFAIAAFDYSDSSGEPGDRAREHEDRTVRFGHWLRDRLGARSGVNAFILPCASSEACTAATVPPDTLVSMARAAKADFLIFGRIHKMSTLVGWARVDVLDVESGLLVFDRVLSFRGDNDEAFERTADFASKDIMRSVVSPVGADGAPARGIR